MKDGSRFKLINILIDRVGGRNIAVTEINIKCFLKNLVLKALYLSYGSDLRRKYEASVHKAII